MPRTLLVRFNVIDSVLHELCNFFALSSDVFKAARDCSIVELLNIVGRIWLHLSLVERLLPLVHHFAHFYDVRFHLLDEFINFDDSVHCILDELVNV